MGDQRPEFKWEMPFYAPCFPLDLTFEAGRVARNLIDESIYGRVGSRPEDLQIIADMVRLAGHGDHLELGSFMGGTAIMAALTKKKYSLDGRIICVDNFTYLQNEYPVGPELIMENAATLNVEDYIDVIQANTYPLPEELRTREFVTAIIDADHRYAAAKNDFLGIRERVTRFIMFHDFDYNHTGVMRAVHDAARDPSWQLVLILGNSAVLERTG